MFAVPGLLPLVASPLAEGRELKYGYPSQLWCRGLSPLAEGRELKCPAHVRLKFVASPLAEGRELKYPRNRAQPLPRVAPRGGA